MTVTDLLAEHAPEVAETAKGIRAIVRDALGDAVEEKVYPGWHGIGYHHPRAGYVCGIFPRRSDVRLGFERGAEVPDDAKRLVGSGSRVRYLVLRAGDRLPAEEIRELIDAAIFIAGRSVDSE